LLLEHFFLQDILTGVDSDDEHYFVKKTLDNYALIGKWPESFYMGLGEAELADLELISEIIIKYKQPSVFYDLYGKDKVYQELLKWYT
jgi:hypothetical protein